MLSEHNRSIANASYEAHNNISTISQDLSLVFTRSLVFFLGGGGKTKKLKLKQTLREK